MIKYSVDMYNKDEHVITRVMEFMTAQDMENFRQVCDSEDITYRNWERLVNSIQVFRERLTANANDFDGIIADMLARIEELENWRKHNE